MRTYFGNWGFTLGLLALITALLLVPLPFIPVARLAPALADELENLGHPLAFGLAAWFAFEPWCQRIGYSRGVSALLLLLALTMFGAATELAQMVTGRDPTWGDWLGDAFGAGAVTFWRWSRTSPRQSSPGHRGLLALGGLCGVAAVAPLGFTLAAYCVKAAAWPEIWHSDSILLKRFSTLPEGRSAGLVLEEPGSDWSHYDALEIVVRNPHDEPTVLHIRVHDRYHDRSYADRFNRQVSLTGASTTTLRFPIGEIRDGPVSRSLDMTRIAGVIVFGEGGWPNQFEVESVRLATGH